MTAPVNPEYRLRNLLRRVRDLLMGRRLSADPEATGVVDLSDFGKRCAAVAALAAASTAELATVAGPEAATARRLAEELELAARLAERMEALPRTPERIGRQCEVLEEVARAVEAALAAECVLEEPPVAVGLGTLARQERRLFEPFVAFEGRIEDPPPAPVERGPVRRALRRALLDHGEGPFGLAVTGSGRMLFGGHSFEAAGVAPGIARSAAEPPGVKTVLDLREGTEDAALRDFLLVKAVDEALHAVLAPRLPGADLPERARALPRAPGTRGAVRPEAVARDVAGWQAQEAARGVEKLAARRAGPEWARLPRGAYLLRLFLSDDDALAADLLALGPLLRRMEKGEAVEGACGIAERSLPKLLGMVG